MRDPRSIIAASRRLLIIDPPIEDFTAYSLWRVPLGPLRVAAGLRREGKEVAFLDLLDDPAMSLPAPSMPPVHRADGRHGFWKTLLPKPAELRMIPRHYHRFGATDGHIAALLAELPTPDAILIATGMTYWYRSVLHIAKLLRDRFPGVPIVVGGIAARLIPDLFEAAGLSVELGMPYPDADLSTVADLLERYPIYPIELARGCPFTCSYCAAPVLHEGVSALPIAPQAAGLARWHEATGRCDVVFFDDALLWRNGAALKEFLALFDPGRFRFHVPNGLHLREVDADLARFLYLHRFGPLRFGFETVSDRFDAKKEVRMLSEKTALLRAAGYRPADIGVYLLCGMPGQTLAEVERSIRLVVAAGARPYLSEFSPVPGTPLFERHRVESALDHAAEPLYQNNSLSAYRSPLFTPPVMKYLKSTLAALYRAQDTEE